MEIGLNWAGLSCNSAIKIVNMRISNTELKVAKWRTYAIEKKLSHVMILLNKVCQKWNWNDDM